MNDRLRIEAEARLPTLLQELRHRRRRRRTIRTVAVAAPGLMLCVWILARFWASPASPVAPPSPVADVSPPPALAPTPSAPSAITLVRNDPSIVDRFTVKVGPSPIVTMNDDELFAVLSRDGTPRGLIITRAGVRIVAIAERRPGRS